MHVIHMSIHMRFVAEDQHTNSTQKTNTVMIFLVSSQIVYTRKRG
jgi:hypothetical protein